MFEGTGRRAAEGAGAHLAEPVAARQAAGEWGCASSSGRQTGQAARVCGVLLVARPKPGECGTGRMRDEVGFAKCGRGRKGGHVEGHGPVVRPVASSAFGQARIICAGRKNGRERPQPEKQDQPNAEGAAYLELMVHERACTRNRRAIKAWPSGMIGVFRFLLIHARECWCLK